VSNELKGSLWGLLGVAAFAFTLPATRFAVPFLDPLFVGLGRAVLAACFAGLLLLLLRQPRPTRAQLIKLVVVALGVVVGFPLLSTWAMVSLSAVHGGVVLGILPLMTAAVAVCLSDERPTIGFWLASVAGSLLVIAFSLLQGVGSFSSGDLVLFGAMLLAAMGYAVGGLLAKELGGWQVICWALVIALPFTLLPALLHFPLSWEQIPGSAWLAFLYLAIISQLFAFFFWNKGLALGGVARVSQTQLLQPFITIIAAVFLLGERVDIITIAFAVTVASVVIVGNRMKMESTINGRQGGRRGN